MRELPRSFDLVIRPGIFNTPYRAECCVATFDHWVWFSHQAYEPEDAVDNPVTIEHHMPSGEMSEFLFPSRLIPTFRSRKWRRMTVYMIALLLGRPELQDFPEPILRDWLMEQGYLPT